MNMNKFKTVLCTLTFLFTAAIFNCIQAQDTLGIKNIVLVHGAFVDGSGWQSVHDILTDQGYKVIVTQHSLTTFNGDVEAVKRILDQQSGSCILVGHSYGGAIISEVGNHPNVMGLVYIAAHVPDDGESRADIVKKYPPAYKLLIKGKDGWDYIDPKLFPADFAADLPKQKAEFMANSQTPTADEVFQAIIYNVAWKTKPSWYMVATSDRIINPDLERMYAERAKSATVEIEGASHAVFISHPKEVANLIIAAAKESTASILNRSMNGISLQ